MAFRYDPRLVRKSYLRAAALIVLLVAAYLGYLAMQNARVEAYFARMRIDDPVRYLDDLRRNEGFESYLAKYRILEAFTSYRDEVPIFLLGRWSMSEKLERLAPGATVSDCVNPIAFETGALKIGAGETAIEDKATFRIRAQQVIVRTDAHDMLTIDLVIYGNSIDHLEFTPPGGDHPVYAYYCGI